MSWDRVKEVFAGAIALPVLERQRFVDGQCEDDASLRQEVNELIAAHESASSFLASDTGRGDTVATALPVPRQIGPYRISGVLGRGGMGLVYDAVDERLNRAVAIKVILDHGRASEAARERFRREARVVAGVNHPHVCQIHDVGDEGGVMFLVMERLTGESLSTRLSRGPMPLNEAVNTTLELLSALEVIHRHGIVHRDLKPGNIFLTPHGAKLLDFGLARRAHHEETHASLTAPGTLLGTPQYMAPEQVNGEDVDERADIFASSVILYEMLSGVSPFAADSLPAVLQRIVQHDPPMLGGDSEVTGIDGILHHGLAKHPSARYPTAGAMAEQLRHAIESTPQGHTGVVTPVTRIIVLPFRLLTPDADIDFLPFSLADAVATSLSSLDTLVVRSSMVAAKFAASAVDVAQIAEQAKVDVLLTGTLMRAGTRLRVAIQLVEAPSGRLMWSETSQVEMTDIFLLQDDLTKRIVESLALPLSSRERRGLQRNVPASAQAYEYYLRATQLARDSQSVEMARDMYLQAVRADPNYAPAWARLGHLHRVIGKYRGEPDSTTRAEAALTRALELNPDLTFADRIYAQIEVDHGRSLEAMARLLRRSQRSPNDPDVFAGLVHSCRYCGLFLASIAAHRRAKRIDPAVRTSLQYTLFMDGQYERAIAEANGLDSIEGISLVMLGDPAGAVRCREQARQLDAVNLPHIARFVGGVAAMAEGDVRPVRTAIDAWIDAGLRDPEAWFLHGLLLAGGGDHDRAVQLLEQATSAGYTLYNTLERHRWLDPLRERQDFKKVIEQARLRCERAATVLRELGPISI